MTQNPLIKKAKNKIPPSDPLPILNIYSVTCQLNRIFCKNRQMPFKYRKNKKPKRVKDNQMIKNNLLNKPRHYAKVFVDYSVRLSHCWWFPVK